MGARLTRTEVATGCRARVRAMEETSPAETPAPQTPALTLSPMAQWRIKIEVSPSPEKSSPLASPSAVLQRMQEASQKGLFEAALSGVVGDVQGLCASASPVRQTIDMEAFSHSVSVQTRQDRDPGKSHPNTAAMGPD